MLRIITNFAPKLYLTWLVWEIRAFQRLQIHLGRWARQDKAAQSGSNLNITCALLKMPKSFKLLERIFSLINCVCWRVHNNALHLEEWTGRREAACAQGAARNWQQKGGGAPSLFESMKVFIPAAVQVWKGAGLYRERAQIPGHLCCEYWGERRAGAVRLCLQLRSLLLAVSGGWKCLSSAPPSGIAVLHSDTSSASQGPTNAVSIPLYFAPCSPGPCWYVLTSFHNYSDSPR